jgi:hypothetical protein
MLLSEHPAALAAPVSSSREGGVWSELLTIPATAKRIRPGIDQAFTTRCWASLALVWMANPT